MAPLPPLRDGGCALPICPFGRACLPLISDAPDCKCSPGRLRFWVVWASCPACASSNFNPRAPCGARPAIVISMRDGDRFQSTRPVWGATAVLCKRHYQHTISIHAPRVGRDADTTIAVAQGNISIHAPRVGRDSIKRSMRSIWRISIHAPRVGRDLVIRRCYCILPYFNPRAPCGARRGRGLRCWHVFAISIHAPRVGRD